MRLREYPYLLIKDLKLSLVGFKKNNGFDLETFLYAWLKDQENFIASYRVVVIMFRKNTKFFPKIQNSPALRDRRI